MLPKICNKFVISDLGYYKKLRFLSHFKKRDNNIFTCGTTESFYKACIFNTNTDLSLPIMVRDIFIRKSGQPITVDLILENLSNPPKRTLLNPIIQHLLLNDEIQIRLPRKSLENDRMCGAWSTKHEDQKKGSHHNAQLLILKHITLYPNSAWLSHLSYDQEYEDRYGIKFAHHSINPAAKILKNIGIIDLAYEVNQNLESANAPAPRAYLMPKFKAVVESWASKGPDEILNAEELKLIKLLIKLNLM